MYMSVKTLKTLKNYTVLLRLVSDILLSDILLSDILLSDILLSDIFPMLIYY